jgi:hypothetical protein
LDDREGDGRVDADDERTIAELRRLRWLVDRVLIVEDLPDDPAVVELGKAVMVRDGQASWSTISSSIRSRPPR